MKKHILVISQYFYPEPFRINDICEEWINKGYKVTVLTGIPNYPEGEFYPDYGLFKKRKESYKGIEIIRIPLVARGKKSVTLALNYLSFVISGFFWQLFTRIKADFVFIFEVSPMTQALPGVWYANKNKIPCYLYVQDLWPENVEIIAGVKNKKVLNYIGKMVDYIYRNCTKIFTTSESFVQSIVLRGVEPQKVSYWPQYAEDFYTPMNVERKSKAKLDIIFTGNIGEAQGLDILVQAGILLRDVYKITDISFTIVGDGRYKTILLNKIKEEKLQTIFNFIGRQPAEKIPQLLAESDIAFLSLNNNPVFSKTIPAKLQSYMACGKPILASADGETEKIVNEAECGRVAKSGDVEALVQAILHFYKMNRLEITEMGNKSRLYYDSYFNKTKLLNEMDNYFK